MDREEILKESSDLLSVFSHKVDTLSKSGYLSVNKISESVYKRLLNELLGLELNNINTSENQNYPAIDLIDEKNKIAFQITSDNSNSKVYTTLEKFIDFELYYKVDELYIFSITKRNTKVNIDRISRILSKLNASNLFKFSVNRHVIDNVYIINKLQELEIPKCESFLEILREELSELYRLFPKGRVSGTEVYITFSSENYSLALKVIEGLVNRNYIVYHNYAKIEKEPTLETKRDYVIYTNGPGTNKIEKCLAIISKIFVEEKWRKTGYDLILKSALDSNAEIFVFKTSTITLPAILQSKKILYDPVRIEETDFQKVIDVFSQRVSLNEEFIQSPVIYKRFEYLIKKAYPNSSIERIVADDKKGVEIYMSVDKILGQKSYFLCFHRGAELKSSCELILQGYPVIEKSPQKIVLLPRERNLEISNRRKEYLNGKLNPIGLFFVEDFVINCLSSQTKLEYIPFDIKDYVEPTILDTSDSDLNYQWVLDWFDASNKPILVIKGLGGVGKSTLVYKLSDEFNNMKPDANVIYINAIEHLTELERLKIKDHDFDLYYFYNAYIDKMQNFHHQIMQLDDETFRAALDSGNILFIIDGLDEVIAHFPQFNVDEFIKSTLAYSEDLGKGKIIITCRSYFWSDTIPEDDSQSDDALQFSVVSLQPFDDSLAQQFFEAKLPESIPGRNIRIKKSMELAQSFINPNINGQRRNHDGNRYIPFVLSIINNMMDYEEQLDEYESNDFDTNYLSPISKTDYITHGICFRERSRIGEIGVNDQVLFFINLSISNYAGTNLEISFTAFDDLLREFNNFYHENARDTFKSHPLFKVNKKEQIISFRYDFLTEYFKSIYLASFINGTNVNFAFQSLTIKLIANYIRINSGFTKEIYAHISEYNSATHERIKDLIWKCYSYEGQGINQEQRTRAMSGLMGLAILLKTKYNPQIDNNTDLIKEIFGHSTGINDFHVVDFTLFDDHLKTVFNFSGLILKDCTFNNYDYFWECKFDENTKFINCVIKNMKEYRYKETSLNKENFIECVLDEWIRKMFEEKPYDAPKKQLSQIKGELKIFLKIFILAGRTRTVSIKNNIAPSYSQKRKFIDHKKIIDELLVAGMIKESDTTSHGDKIQIVKELEKEVLAFCENGIRSKKIAEVMNKLAIYV